MTFLAKPYLLTSKIQPYAWGEKGPAAYIAQLLDLTKVENDAPFAELWMGTHPLGMSTVMYDGKQLALSELIERYPIEILGQRVATAFANQFPFLLKVLSADEPLSIQVHPSQAEAVLLHEKDPAHYPGANHKPESAIVLDTLYTIAGLRKTQQITLLLQTHPEINDLVGLATFSGHPKHLHSKLAFLALLQNIQKNPEKLRQVIDQLVVKFNKKANPTYREKLFLEMSSKYPGDMGLLMIFFLKLYKLHRGQAIYTPAGIPHAYLKGNIIECMASSDNVIRVGLTPKFTDIASLADVVTDKSILVYSPKTESHVFTTPAKEFRVSKFALAAGQKITNHNDGVRLLLILQGELNLTWSSGSLKVTKGEAILLPANLPKVAIECLTASEIYITEVP